MSVKCCSCQVDRSILALFYNFTDIDKWLLEPDRYIGCLISYVDIGLAQMYQHWHLRSQSQQNFKLFVSISKNAVVAWGYL